MPKPTSNPLPLAERIHRAKVALYKSHDGACRVGISNASYLAHRDHFDVAIEELDAIGKEVAALTAKVESGHIQDCDCAEDKRFGTSELRFYVDPRCVEWRRK